MFAISRRIPIGSAPWCSSMPALGTVAVTAASRVIGSVAAIQGVAPSRRPYAFHWCCMFVIASEACWWVTAAHGGVACVCGKLEM